MPCCAFNVVAKVTALRRPILWKGRALRNAVTLTDAQSTLVPFAGRYVLHDTGVSHCLLTLHRAGSVALACAY
jgi:hypothetical protein